MRKDIEKLVLKSNVSELNKIVSFVENIADKYYLNDSYFANMMVALTEAFKNALKHGNKNDESKKITIEFYISNSEMIFDVSDEGNGFDFQTFLNTKRDPNQRGIDLIYHVSDNVVFSDNGSKISISFNMAAIDSDISKKRIEAMNLAKSKASLKNENIGS